MKSGSAMRARIAAAKKNVNGGKPHSALLDKFREKGKAARA